MAEYPHFLLREVRSSQRYIATTSGGGQRNVPPRPERKAHGQKLLDDLLRAEKVASLRLKQEPIREGLQFVPMRFTEGSDFEMELERLEKAGQGVRVVSVRELQGVKEYLVAIPDSQVKKVAKKFRTYREEDTQHGKPKNEALASGIAAIESAELADYWTAPDEALPADDESLWWEVWLEVPEGGDSTTVENWFRTTAAAQKITLSPQRVRFPDRLVVLAYAALVQWRMFPGLLQHLAEFRRANLVAGEFTRLTPAGQAEKINRLLERTRFAPERAVRICILDTGVDRGHPLLQQALAFKDMHTWEEPWGADDHHGHGTQLAGVCLFGPLSDPLDGVEKLELDHGWNRSKSCRPLARIAHPIMGRSQRAAWHWPKRQRPRTNVCFAWR